MHGEPADVEGDCNARLYVADNYGDNHVTMRCQREPNHEGLHHEIFGGGKSGKVVVTWETDARVKCDHGCGQWNDHGDDVSCVKFADEHDFETCRLCHGGREPHVCACGAEYYGSRHFFCPNAPSTPKVDDHDFT